MAFVIFPPERVRSEFNILDPSSYFMYPFLFTCCDGLYDFRFVLALISFVGDFSFIVGFFGGIYLHLLVSNKISALDDVDIYVYILAVYQGRHVPPMEQELTSLSEQLSLFPFVVGFVWLNLLFSMLC